MYKFGGDGGVRDGDVSGSEVKGSSFLLEGMLRVLYLAAGREGAVCPVWVETR